MLGSLKIRQLAMLLPPLLLSLHLVHAQERNITIPTPTRQADPPNSVSRIGNNTSPSSVSQNITATGSRNNTSATNSTRTSSAPDPTKPFATDFQTQTYRVPAPAPAGGGEVAQSPDDSVRCASVE